jgi:hypothetical protein
MNMQRVTFNKDWGKKWHTLNVIPVIVGKKPIRFDWLLWL